MKGIAVVGLLAIVLLVLAPATVSAAIVPGDEETTIQLIGHDGHGNFTILLKQTATGTNNVVFELDLAVTSNFEWASCLNFVAAVSGLSFADAEPYCERDLWLAVVLPDSRLFFLEALSGGALSLQNAGSVANLPFLPNIRPYYRLGTYFAGNYLIPYASGYLFSLTQTAVNALPPGRYSIFAAYSYHMENAANVVANLFDLQARMVSNVDQYDIIIEEPSGQCSEVQTAGGDAPDTRLFDLGNIGGTFRFDFQTFSQKDRMIVSYEGQTLFDTGCVGTSGSVLLTFHGSSTKVKVQVLPNCQGGSGTAWNYIVHCLL